MFSLLLVDVGKKDSHPKNLLFFTRGLFEIICFVAHAPQLVWRPKNSLGSQLSLCAVWVPGVELRSEPSCWLNPTNLLPLYSITFLSQKPRPSSLHGLKCDLQFYLAVSSSQPATEEVIQTPDIRQALLDCGDTEYHHHP